MSLRSVEHAKAILLPNLVTLQQAWAFHEAEAEALAGRLEAGHAPENFNAAVLFRALPFLSAERKRGLAERLKLDDAGVQHLWGMSVDHGVIVCFVISHHDLPAAVRAVHENGFATDNLIARAVAYGLTPLAIMLLLERLSEKVPDYEAPRIIGRSGFLELWAAAGCDVDLIQPLQDLAERASVGVARSKFYVTRLGEHLRESIDNSFDILQWQAPDYLVAELLAGKPTAMAAP